jgi:hypothetical protein
MDVPVIRVVLTVFAIGYKIEFDFLSVPNVDSQIRSKVPE